jgi:multiple sugar transport system permease protein
VSEFGLFWRICLPLSRSAVAVVAIFTFLGQWNDFLWPLIVINSNKMQTLQIGLSRLSSLETGADWGGTMSGAALASIPMLIVFMFFQKQIISGMKLSGLKG